jgi:hypothetical protein
MMDIRKLDVQNWLTLDKNYMEEHSVRDDLLREKRDKVLQCLPESAQACQEALEEVSEFLCERYPNMFQKVVEGDRASIQNCMTGERFDIGGAASGGEGIDALEAAVRLTMEDLSILMMNEEAEYYLYGSHFTFFPSFFSGLFLSVSLTRFSAPPAQAFSRRDGRSRSVSDGPSPVCTNRSLCGISTLRIP